MPISKSKRRPVSTRRANRPDQTVYRALRLNRIYRPKSLLWLEILIGVMIFAGLLFLLRRWL